MGGGNRLGSVLKPALERFNEKTAPGPDGCIEWTGGTNGVGYGQFYRGRSSLEQTGKTYAHRWAYEQFVGPIPEGMELDHLCRNRKCVNTAHLEPVTRRENNLRGTSPAALHAKKTHCPSGHPYVGDNLYIHPAKGQRYCRTCGRLAARKRYDRNKTKKQEH